MEELHRQQDMRNLVQRRKEWVGEQTHHTRVWQVSGGSLVTRAIQGGEAFNLASGIRQLGVQKVPVASVAPTQALSALTAQPEELDASFAPRESRAHIRKVERVSLLAAVRQEEEEAAASRAAGPVFLLDDDAPPGAPGKAIVDDSDVLLNMDLGGSTSMELALQGTSLEHGAPESVKVSNAGDDLSLVWRADMERCVSRGAR
jgi:hypothetical protein